MSCGTDGENYTDAGKEVLKDLGISNSIPLSAGEALKNQHLSLVWGSDDTGGNVYCGAYTAAQSAEVIEELAITHIVNCAEESSPNYFEGRKGLSYLRFNVEEASRQCFVNPEKIREVWRPYFEFVERATNAGENVLVHCHAGAHRAGTAVIGWLMRELEVDYVNARLLAKQKRGVVNPIAKLDALLNTLDKALREDGNY